MVTITEPATAEVDSNSCGSLIATVPWLQSYVPPFPGRMIDPFTQAPILVPQTASMVPVIHQVPVNLNGYQAATANGFHQNEHLYSPVPVLQTAVAHQPVVPNGGTLVPVSNYSTYYNSYAAPLPQIVQSPGYEMNGHDYGADYVYQNGHEIPKYIPCENGVPNSNIVHYSSNADTVPYPQCSSKPLICFRKGGTTYFVPRHLLPIYQRTMKLNLAPYPSATIPNGSVVSCVQSNQVVPVAGVNSSFVSCNQPDANGACIQGLCQMAPATVLRPYATIPGAYTVPAPPLIPASESWPPSPPIPSFLQTAKWEQAFGMGDMWKREFHARFRNFAPHQWVILPVYEKPNHGIEWRNFTEAAKVRFNCKVCNHSWTSMQGKVAFWYALTENCVGYVCLQLFSQRCRECLEAKRDAPFQPALWYPEELERVLNNFYNEVGFRVYHFVPQPFQRDRRPGKPRTPHNSDLCQACDDNMCVKKR